MEFHIYDHTTKLPIGLPVTKLSQSIDQWLKDPKHQAMLCFQQQSLIYQRLQDVWKQMER